MSRLRLGSNFAVFALFFGLSLLETFQAVNWLRAAFWLAIATVFLYADRKRRQELSRSPFINDDRLMPERIQSSLHMVIWAVKARTSLD